MTSTSGLVGNLGQANYSAAKLGIVALSKSIALDMQKFGVRSNCIAPFAWSRMTSSIPAETPEQQARVDRLKQMTPEKIAPLAVYLASDASSAVNAQVFAVRNNEIFVMSQPRPLRSVHRSEGWTAAVDRRARHAGAEVVAGADGALRRRLQLGPGLSSAAMATAVRHAEIRDAVRALCAAISRRILPQDRRASAAIPKPSSTR